MKIMWITNTIIGDMYEQINNEKSNGLWMDALLNTFSSKDQHELIVVTTGRNKKEIYLDSNNIKYYILPGGYPIEYKHSNKNNIIWWSKLLEKEKPDIVQVWGTEFQHGLVALEADIKVPSVIYMQGISKSIYSYYYADLKYSEILINITFRDILRKDSVINQRNRFRIQTKYEKKILQLSGNVISENMWCDTHCKAIAPNIEIHRCQLSINEVFTKYKWEYDKMMHYTVMCNASGYPLKGLHIILKALRIVKIKYPTIKLVIPGEIMVTNHTITSILRRRGYTKYIEKLIKMLELESNIEFTGMLSAEQMAQRLSIVNVFVMGSAIENHSSTLKEAMMIGVPCITSFVGGIQEYAIHRQNVLMYRYEEYEMLAQYIVNIIENEQLARQLSENAMLTSRHPNIEDDIYERIIKTYNTILREG